MRFRWLKCLHLSVWGWGGLQQKGAQFARALVSSVCRSALSWILQGCVLWIGLSCAVVTERSFSTHSRQLCVPGYFSNWVSHLATGGHTDATAGRVHSCAQLLCALLWWRAARQAAVDSREIPVVQLGGERAFRKKTVAPLPAQDSPPLTTPYLLLGRFESLIFEASTTRFAAVCSRNGEDSLAFEFPWQVPWWRLSSCCRTLSLS